MDPGEWGSRERANHCGWRLDPETKNFRRKQKFQKSDTLVSMEQEYKLGPKMQALTEKQRLFVEKYIQMGSRGATKCYLESGYSQEKEGARHNSSRLLHTKKIQDAILEETGRKLRAHAPVALDSLLHMAKNPKHKDHFAAVKHLLDVSGFTPKQKVDISHSGTVDVSWDQFKAQLEQMRQLNLPAPMIDVTPDDNAE